MVNICRCMFWIEPVNHIEWELRRRSLMRLGLQQPEVRRRIVRVILIVVGEIVRRMIRNDVLNQIHAAAMQLARQPSIVVQGAKMWINLFKIDGPIAVPTGCLVGRTPPLV